MIPEKSRIRSFKTQAEFEAWLAKHHEREPELWIRFFKKDSGIATVTYAQALDVALCWGWIDGIRKAHDAQSFLQRFTPRRPKSRWSQVNRGHVERLMKGGRICPPGQREVDAAKADGRWDAATAPIRATTVSSIPPDLMKAIKASPRAMKTLKTLKRADLFGLMVRVNQMKTPAGRSRKIEELVARLARGWFE